MRPVHELINNIDPGWTFVEQWIDSLKVDIGGQPEERTSQ
jgi:hypothetical protein